MSTSLRSPSRCSLDNGTTSLVVEKLIDDITEMRGKLKTLDNLKGSSESLIRCALEHHFELLHLRDNRSLKGAIRCLQVIGRSTLEVIAEIKYRTGNRTDNDKTYKRNEAEKSNKMNNSLTTVGKLTSVATGGETLKRDVVQAEILPCGRVNDQKALPSKLPFVENLSQIYQILQSKLPVDFPIPKWLFHDDFDEPTTIYQSGKIQETVSNDLKVSVNGCNELLTQLREEVFRLIRELNEERGNNGELRKKLKDVKNITEELKFLSEEKIRTDALNAEVKKHNADIQRCEQLALALEQSKQELTKLACDLSEERRRAETLEADVKKLEAERQHTEELVLAPGRLKQDLNERECVDGTDAEVEKHIVNRQRFEELAMAFEQSKQDLAKLGHELSEERHRTEELDGEVKKLEAQRQNSEELLKTVEKSKQELEKIGQELSNERRRAEALDEEIRKLKAEKQRSEELAETLDTTKQEHDLVDERKRVETLDGEVKRLEAERRHSEELVIALEQSKLEKHLSDEMKQFDRLDEEMKKQDSERQRCEELAAAFQKSKQEISKLARDLSDERKNVEALNAEVKKQDVGVVLALELSKQELTILTQDLSDERHRVQTLEAEVKKLEAERQHSEELVVAFEQSKQEIAKLRKELAEIVAKHELEKQSSDEVMLAFKLSEEELMKLRQELLDERNRAAALEREVDNFNAERYRNEELVMSVEQSKQEQGNEMSDMDENTLKKQLAEAEAVCSKLTLDLTESRIVREEEIHEYENTLREARKEIQLLSDSLSYNDSKTGKFNLEQEEKIDALECDVKSLTAKNTEALAENKILLDANCALRGYVDALQERLEHERVNNSALKREFNLESMIRKRLIRYDQEEADDMRAIIWSQHIEVISILLKIMSKFQAQLPGMFLDCENPEENMRYSSPAIRKRDMCRTFQHRKESQEFEYDSHPVVKWSTSSSKVDLRYENISWLITTRAPLVQALGEYNRELFDGSIDRSLFKLRKIRVKFLEILRDFLSPVEKLHIGLPNEVICLPSLNLEANKKKLRRLMNHSSINVSKPKDRSQSPTRSSCSRRTSETHTFVPHLTRQPTYMRSPQPPLTIPPEARRSVSKSSQNSSTHPLHQAAPLV